MKSTAYFESSYCELAIDSPAKGVVRMTIAGRDIGEFGNEPMAQLEKYLSDDPTIELYIDARHTQSASIEVSSDWARWLGANRSHFSRVSMLTGSRFIEITAGLVRSFSDLQDVMRIYTDERAFEEALASSIADASRN